MIFPKVEFRFARITVAHIHLRSVCPSAVFSLCCRLVFQQCRHLQRPAKNSVLVLLGSSQYSGSKGNIDGTEVIGLLGLAILCVPSQFLSPL